MTDFDKDFEALLLNEGGYSNNPDDPGGETKWGITERVARENGYTGAMEDMDVSVARMIYRRRYWSPVFDTLPYPLAFQLFDATVNSGEGQAIRWLQRAVGVAEDGKFGPVTSAAVEAMDAHCVVALFNAERLETLTSLAGWKTFGKGWARRVAKNIKRGMKA